MIIGFSSFGIFSKTKRFVGSLLVPRQCINDTSNNTSPIQSRAFFHVCIVCYFVRVHLSFSLTGDYKLRVWFYCTCLRHLHWQQMVAGVADTGDQFVDGFNNIYCTQTNHKENRRLYGICSIWLYNCCLNCITVA